MMFATAIAGVEVVRHLLDAGACATKCASPPRRGLCCDAQMNGARPLHLAAYRGALEIVKLLVERGADVDIRNPQGGTPLRSAAAEGQLACVQYLLERGAQPDPVDAMKKKPVDYARDNGHAEIVALLTRAAR